MADCDHGSDYCQCAANDKVRRGREPLIEEIAALTAQVEAKDGAIRSVLKECSMRGEAILVNALSLTPAEALERAKRDAEERRLMEAALKDWARLYADTDARTSHRWPPEIRKLLEVYDNFRKGAGR